MNYDLTSIQDTFLSLIPFRRDYNTSDVDADLIGLSPSGKYLIEGVNPLITNRNLKAFMPESSDMDVPSWDNSITYNKWDAVSDSGSYYKSKVDTNLNHAVTDTAYWTPTTLYSIWIRQRLFSIIERVVGAAITSDKLLDFFKSYSLSDDSDELTNESKYVGFEIRPCGSENLNIVLNKIGIQLSEAQSDLTLYLYNQNTQVATVSLGEITAKEFSFADITDQELKGGGRWFLFYNQDDLTGEAYNSHFVNPSTFVDLLPFEVSNTTTDFVNEVSGYAYNSYGLGLEVSIFPDLTDFILSNKKAFVDIIHLQWQYDILELIHLNPDAKVGPTERSSSREVDSEYILGELKSENPNTLISRLNRAYSHLHKSLKFPDPALPGDNIETVTYTSFG